MLGLSIPTKWTAAAAAAVIVLCLAGCGSAAAPAPASHPDARRFLSVDAAARTVRLSVVLGYGQTATQNIDGANKGALGFVVPVGWKVLFECVDRLAPARYACALVPAPGTAEAQHGVTYILHPAQGLSAGRSATFAFAPTAPARYRIVGLAHLNGSWVALAGMWVVLRVTAGGVPRAHWLR
ncbi:MAG TPA: hypothetical protein VGP17_13125 [Solirubrobacteraceae bacterium]|nr:hypothetical protein [Solirubrobacteraceae bacterium]